jgi:hypothetical protein
MQARATPTTAAVTGLYCGLLAWVLQPLVDGQGTYASMWLLLGAGAIGVPAYYFVFGLGRAQMVGAWLVEPSLLKRIAACFLGAGVAAAAGLLVSVVLAAVGLQT